MIEFQPGNFWNTADFFFRSLHHGSVPCEIHIVAEIIDITGKSFFIDRNPYGSRCEDINRHLLDKRNSRHFAVPVLERQVQRVSAKTKRPRAYFLNDFIIREHRISGDFNFCHLVRLIEIKYDTEKSRQNKKYHRTGNESFSVLLNK